MARLEIEHDEDIYEGKLYGWRWFVAVHGLWIVTPPMFPVKRTRDNHATDLRVTKDSETYFRLLRDYYAALDLFDWNQSDVPPDIPKIRTQREVTIPTGHSSGFHLFRGYSDAVNYAVVPYDCKRDGFQTPHNPHCTTPDHMTEHVFNTPDLRLKVTPLLAFVEASGAIVEHEKGYRAHLIRVVSLYSDGRKRARQELADNIGWPGEIRKFSKLRTMENPSDTQLRRLDCD